MIKFFRFCFLYSAFIFKKLKSAPSASQRRFRKRVDALTFELLITSHITTITLSCCRSGFYRGQPYENPLSRSYLAMVPLSCPISIIKRIREASATRVHRSACESVETRCIKENKPTNEPNIIAIFMLLQRVRVGSVRI